MDPELIIFAAVAVFVISRLYSVLGSRTGAEPPPSVAREAARRRVEEDDEPAARASNIRPAFTGPGAAGMEAIAAVDPGFEPAPFLQGAKQAYEMTVGAFADGDRKTLKSLLNDEVYEAYEAAIDEREASGREPLRLMRLKSAEIAGAELGADDMARVSVSFEASLSDGENQRIAKEIWTFERPARSRDPNWLLAEVSEAS